MLEIWPVVVAIMRWGHLWKDKKVRLWTDNTQVCQMVNTGRSRSVKCMWWIREIFWLTAIHNIHLVSSHVRSHLNIVPDFLSRLYDPKRKSRIPSEYLSPFCCFRDGWVETEAEYLPRQLDGEVYNLY